MDIFESTSSYERWMREQTSVVESHLRYKHAIMKDDLFRFLKAPFYRWIQLWAEHTPADLKCAPKLLAVGDLHVDSFGTWRDLEGRLVWGIDDFDEAHPLPYTNDLVRLGASVKIAIDSDLLKIHPSDACEAILDAYRKGLRSNGCPLTLAEPEQHLEQLGVLEIKPVKHFWQKLNHVKHSKRRCRIISTTRSFARWPEPAASAKNDSSPLASGRERVSLAKPKRWYHRPAFG
jgi:uncharacterized protein (DUF2252 family)